jgi:hypothetical protein
MALRSCILTTLYLLATTLNAQSTSIDASQSIQISSALASYESSLIHGPVATSLALEVAFDIPASELTSLASNVENLASFPTTNQYSYATAPPVTDLSTPAWATTLPSGVQSDLLSLETSVILAEASILRSVLGITQTPSVASASDAAAASSSTSTESGAAKSGDSLILASAFTALAAVALVVLL